MHINFQISANFEILYVEDDEISRKSLSLIMKRKYPCATLHLAKNGKEGLEIFEKERPGLVITDIIMPVMDGIQMIKSIRSVCPDVGIIVTSASCEAETFFHDVNLDSRYYLCKPIDINRLFEVIDECIIAQISLHEKDCPALVC